MSNILIKSLPEPPINEKEILRYAGVIEPTAQISAILSEAIDEARSVLAYKVCYTVLSVNITGTVCDFSVFSLDSKDLTKNLEGCKEAVVFAATLGVGLDRLINKYSRISPTKAVLLDAFGAERIEALCDAFCYSLKVNSKPRFSAGYGDLPLGAQKDIFSLLYCQKNIGLTLNDSLTMSPSKSVTAFMGIRGNTI